MITELRWSIAFEHALDVVSVTLYDTTVDGTKTLIDRKYKKIRWPWQKSSKAIKLIIEDLQRKMTKRYYEKKEWRAAVYEVLQGLASPPLPTIRLVEDIPVIPIKV